MCLLLLLGFNAAHIFVYLHRTAFALGVGTVHFVLNQSSASAVCTFVPVEHLSWFVCIAQLAVASAKQSVVAFSCTVAQSFPDTQFGHFDLQ